MTFRGTYVTNPKSARGSVDLLTWINQGAQRNFVGKDTFFQGPGAGPDYDYPNPRGYVGTISLRTWIDPVKQQLIAKDTFFDGAGKGVTLLDWPVPKGPQQGAIDLKTWITPINRFVGKDTFFGGVGEGPVYDYPNPRGPQQGSIELRSWENFYAIDALPGFNYDFPNPRGYVGSIDLKTWLQGYIFDVLPPSFNYDFPNPRGAVGVIDLKTWLQAGLSTSVTVVQPPFLPGDWPVPKGYTATISLKTWIDPTKQQLIGQDQFFAGPGVGPDYDWPNPRGPQQGSVELKTWLQGFSLNLEAEPVVYTFDYPNPRAAIGSISLRTWIDPTKQQLIGQDQFFRGAGDAPSYDYPNPRGATGTIDLRTFLQGYSLNLFTAPIIYPATITFDYPNPRGATGTISLRTWVDATKQQLIGKDTFFGSPGMGPDYDYPNPRAPVGSISLKTWTISYNIAIPPVAGGLNYDITPPKTAQGTVSLRTWIDATKLNLIAQDQFYGGAGQAPENTDWPVPRGATSASVLRSWLDQTKLNLAGQDQFFRAPGQGPSYDYPNPRAAQRLVDLTWIYGKTSAPVVITAIPSLNFDWPLPKGSQFSISLRGFLSPLQAWFIPPPIIATVWVEDFAFYMVTTSMSQVALAIATDEEADAAYNSDI